MTIAEAIFDETGGDKYLTKVEASKVCVLFERTNVFGDLHYLFSDMSYIDIIDGEVITGNIL